MDHEPVGLKKNKFSHDIQRGRISPGADFERINTVFFKEPFSVTTRLSLERSGLEENGSNHVNLHSQFSIKWRFDWFRPWALTTLGGTSLKQGTTFALVALITTSIN